MYPGRTLFFHSFIRFGIIPTTTFVQTIVAKWTTRTIKRCDSTHHVILSVRPSQRTRKTKIPYWTGF